VQLHDILLGLVAFASELLGTISGFGSSTFFVPTALFFKSFKFVLVLTALLHCFGNFSKIALFRKPLNWKLFFELALPSVLMTVLGAWLSNKVPVELIKKLLGISLIIFPILNWIGLRRKKKISLFLGIILMALSGFLTGLVGTGGAVRGIALSALKIEKNNFVLLSAAIDMGGDLLRAIIYLAQGYMDWTQWFFLPILGTGAFLGSYVGRHILKRLKQSQFEVTVGIFIFISGILLLLGTT
jgi:uncharacterized membrane protein YfcA